MIPAAMVLVAIAAALLVVGVVRGDDLAFVYAAIAVCLVAAGLLTAGVLRARPRPRRPPFPAGEGNGPGRTGGPPADEG